MKLLSLILLVLSTAFAGDGATNGGWVHDMLEADLRERNPITKQILKKLLERNGRDVKREILIPTIKAFIQSTEPLSDDLMALRKILKPIEEELYDDILFSPIRPGKCLERQSLCTSSSAYSDVIIDEESVLGTAFGLTFSELVGLIAHEYTHHFAGDIDHPNYSFARYVRNNIKSNSYGMKTFGVNDMVGQCENEQYRYHRCLFAPHRTSQAQEQANIFCQQHKFKRAHSYSVENIPNLEWRRNHNVRVSGEMYAAYYFKYTYGGNYRRQGEAYDGTNSASNVFTQIKCGF